MGIRIGFVDYKLENYHANVFLKAYRDALKDRGAVVAGCFALDADNGNAWAAHNDVPWFASVEAMNDHVDGFMVLAPSNPELHLKLAEMVLPLNKATYIDKTFAPDVGTAKKIFALADEHQTPVQTTSALRYTNVQPAVKRDELLRNIQRISRAANRFAFGCSDIRRYRLTVSKLLHVMPEVQRVEMILPKLGKLEKK